jgi:nicotinamidase-related amidase
MKSIDSQRPMSTHAIAARPYDYSVLNREEMALLVIDMQRDFFDPSGFGAMLGNDVGNIQPCIPYVEELLAAFRRHRLPIIHTKEAHNPSLSNCPLTKRNRGTGPYRIGDRTAQGRILIEGQPNADFIDQARPVEGETVIVKPGKDAFWGTDLAGVLFNLGIRYLVICGVTTEVCVQTTMREANDRGYICVLAEQATDSYVPEFKHWTIEMIVSQGGIVGWAAKNKAIIDWLDRVPAAAPLYAVGGV